jgi:GNAT superfamily N-acetyltransferase
MPYMWLAYVDESFNSTYHYVTALLVRDDRVNAAQRALRDIAENAADEYGLKSTVELHGYDLFHGDAGFEPMHGMPRARIALYRDVLKALVDADAWVIVRGVHKPRLEERYVRPDHPHRVVMTHLIEQVDTFCKGERGGGDNALLVADEHHETQSALLRDLVIYQDSGTWGYRAKKITHVVDTIHFVNSKTNALVQGADMVSFMSFRWMTTTERDERAAKAVAELKALVVDRIHHQRCWHP